MSFIIELYRLYQIYNLNSEFELGIHIQMQFDQTVKFTPKSKEFAPNSDLKWIWFEINLKVIEKWYYFFRPLTAHSHCGSLGQAQLGRPRPRPLAKPMPLGHSRCMHGVVWPHQARARWRGHRRQTNGEEGAKSWWKWSTSYKLHTATSVSCRGG
jgi:hypothetical protein